ncbi:HupE/UreJ family protein [Congregibacter brevis]|uniref:HupE/UreJ family protein n=1 Tax=Congregibacter brevis TaxID=3081201 RepID=A0ABZ0IDC4_9GAMM|nr:HupE/UreJ family protein [Congregibacter sp. IMCC45268]
MSRSTVSVHSDGRVTVDLTLDLLATAGSREEYWLWSQQDDPLSDGSIERALSPLPNAIALTANGAGVSLRIEEVNLPEASREEFLDPLAWPRSEIRLTGTLPKSSDTTEPLTLQVSYLDSFIFEEPIANTLRAEANGRKQTRWLVTGQRSPAFLIAAESQQDQPPVVETSKTGSSEARAVFADLLLAGFRHIFPDGIDHLLFVAALFFGSASLAGLVGIVTLFTIAHSLSLGLTALGWISAPASIVEPLILLSIVWIAIANLAGGTGTHTRYPLVLVFGLIHGLGFAAALREIGLPADFLIAGLLAFNLGVEAAQLAFLFCLSAISLLFLRWFPETVPWKRGGSVLIIVLTSAIAGLRFF